MIVSRAAKLAGAPTVASRFVQRLAAVAGERRWAQALARGARYVELARALDAPTGRPQPVARPEPKPPRDARPRSLSVTEIELWLRDPYSIYAKHILKLRPLDAIDTPPGARDRGIVIHGAIGDFTVRFKDKLPDDIVGELHAPRRTAFRRARAIFPMRARSGGRASSGSPAGLRISKPGAAPTSRGSTRKSTARWKSRSQDRVFTLRARADRIEHLR